MKNKIISAEIHVITRDFKDILVDYLVRKNENLLDESPRAAGLMVPEEQTRQITDEFVTAFAKEYDPTMLQKRDVAAYIMIHFDWAELVADMANYHYKSLSRGSGKTKARDFTSIVNQSSDNNDHERSIKYTWDKLVFVFSSRPEDNPVDMATPRQNLEIYRRITREELEEFR